MSAAALAVVLSLTWQDIRQPVSTQEQFGGGSILNLLNTYSGDPTISGWHAVGALTLALLALGAAGAIADLRGAVFVCAAAAVALVVAVAGLDPDVRWPAYAGIALALDLVVLTTWQVRRRLASPA